MFEWLIKIIIGVKLIQVEDVKKAIENCDVDQDGYINVGELITAIKGMVK